MVDGKCLCGKVKIKVDLPKTFSVCHCSSCRTWSGGIFMSFDGGKDLIFEGEKYISRFSSSEWAERGFCKKCGSNLFFKMKKSNYYFLMVGLFGNDISPRFSEQQFYDEKPNFYSFSNETKNVTKSEMNDLLKDYLSKY